MIEQSILDFDLHCATITEGLKCGRLAEDIVKTFMDYDSSFDNNYVLDLIEFVKDELYPEGP